jgi:hypothetical protein
VATVGAVAGSVVAGGGLPVVDPGPGQVATSEPANPVNDERGVIDVFLHRHVPGVTATDDPVPSGGIP